MIKKIGFIGQGWIGKHYANWYQERGHYEIIRYGKEPEFQINKEKIADCDLVYIAVPTPTTPDGFDHSILEEVLSLIGKGKIALIKSTILPGTTRKMQQKFPDSYILFSPEFLTEATAMYDVSNPDRNIIGYASDEAFKVSGQVMSLLPPAPYEEIMRAEEAEMIKYGGNNWFYYKVVYINMLYDLCQKLGIDYEVVKNGMAADKRIGRTHLDPIHKSGRGAGGHCFIKDFEAFRKLYTKEVGDTEGINLLEATINKNLKLLKDTNKDADLLRGVYGE